MARISTQGPPHAYPYSVPEKHHATPEEQQDDRPPFEEVVAALLQVDPKGIAGKHRKAEPEREEGPEH